MASPSQVTYLSNSATIQTESVIKDKPVESTLQKISVASFAYQLALAFYCIAQCIYLSELSYSSTFSSIINLLDYCALGFLLIKILLFTRYSILEVVIYLIFCAIAVLGLYNYGSSQLIYLVLFIIGAKDIKGSTICRTVLPVVVVCSIGIILLSLAGVIGNRAEYTVNALNDEIVYRQAFGFTHYNHLGRLSLVAFICYLYLRYNKFNIFDICLILLLSAILYFVVSSKTAPILMVSGVILILLSKIMPFRGMLIICAILGAIGIVGSILLAYFYDPSSGFMDQINTWLAGRLRQAHYFFDNYPITLFGQSIDFGETGTSSRLILDNAYVSLLFRYGIFALIAVIVGYVIAFIKASKNHHITVIIILTIMLLVGIAEIWIYVLPGIVALAIAFGKHSSESIEKKVTYSTV